MPRCGLMSGMRAPLNTKPSRRAPASTVSPPEDASLETASNAACRIWTSSRLRAIIGSPRRTASLDARRRTTNFQAHRRAAQRRKCLGCVATPRSPSRASRPAAWVASRAPRCPELKVGRGTEGSNPAPIQWSTEPKLKTTSKGRSNTRRSSRRYCGCWKIHKFSKNSSPTTPSARSAPTPRPHENADPVRYRSLRMSRVKW